MPERLLYLVNHGAQEDCILLADRLSSEDFTALHHSPLAHAVETAQVLAQRLPGVPVHQDDLLDDDIPEHVDTHAAYSAFRETGGLKNAQAAEERYVGVPERDERLLIVTNTVLIAWFARSAIATPPWRWAGLKLRGCGLTILSCKENRPPAIVSFNDAEHLEPRSGE
ncbi:histidine phosphatase family protein [Allokutzneria multivorans]|uniref:Histidine phosphatase family protein n=1 Tax=Allokutzneria multivorans TaxID=1142134 RepID=A0ABP7T1R9_9PSEU